jgi:hypothetical protein
MQEAPEGDVRSLRFLRALVTTLMLVMIVGFIVLIALLVTRLPEAGGPESSPLGLPDTISLPPGVVAEAFTATGAWFAIVTEEGQILVYDRADGRLLQTIEIAPAD